MPTPIGTTNEQEQDHQVDRPEDRRAWRPLPGGFDEFGLVKQRRVEVADALPDHVHDERARAG